MRLPLPTIEDYKRYLREEVGFTADNLPDDSPYIVWSLGMALEWVPHILRSGTPFMYMRAVYLYATDRLVRMAPDKYDGVCGAGQGFFAGLRAKFGTGAVGVTGVVTSAGDNATSGSVTLPDWVKDMSIADQKLMQTPWGTEYLSIVQQIGPLWGIS